MKKLILEISLFLIIMTAISALFISSDWDIQLQKPFYNSSDGWFMKDSQPWRLLYKVGTIPGLMLAVSGIVLLILSFTKSKYLKYRKIGAFILLVMIIAPGVIVNAGFKDHWGRIRPRNIQEFNGKYEYIELWEKGVTGKGKSFPCGHASMGFYFFVLFFLYRKTNRKAAVFWFIFAMVYGTLIGIARMAGGGHFASDVLWAGAFVYITCLILYYSLGMSKDIYYVSESAFKVRKTPIIILSLMLGGLIAFYLTSIPYYKDRHFSAGKNIEKLVFTIDNGTIELNVLDSLYIKSEIHGFGFPESSIKQKLATENNTADFSSSTKGLFTELNMATSLNIGRQTDSVFIFFNPEKNNFVFDSLKTKNYVEIVLNDERIQTAEDNRDKILIIIKDIE